MNISYKIIGIGGGGTNALRRLIKRNKLIHKNKIIFMNTDAQSLNYNIDFGQTIQLGDNITSIGAGANPEIGKMSYFKSKNEIFSKIKKEELIILLVTLGGGTGTGVLHPFIQDLKRNKNQFVIITT